MAAVIGTDVLVVGAGPVGLALAIELGLSGVRVVVLGLGYGGSPIVVPDGSTSPPSSTNGRSRASRSASCMTMRRAGIRNSAARCHRRA